MTLIPMEDVRINFPLAKQKGLVNGEDDSLYQQVYNLYQKGLDTFLLQNTPLREYEEKLKNSPLDFGVMPQEKRNPFHKNSYLGLDYFYVRNFLFIEKLSLEDLNVLKEIVKQNNEIIDEVILEIVKRTFKDVIVDNYRDGKYEEKTQTCYGHFIPANVVPSSHLVIALQYGKNNKTYDRDDFYRNQQAKDQFLKEMVEEIKKELESILNIEVTVLIRNFVGE